jgi:hypothetical protein
MTTPEVVCYPDGHYRHAVFSLSPYITDYPEQVWLTGIIQHWCPTYDIIYFCHQSQLLTFLPRCEATPKNLDCKANLHSHEKTQFLLQTFDPSIIWDNYSVHDDVIINFSVIVLLL